MRELSVHDLPTSDNEKWMRTGMDQKEVSQDRYAMVLILAIRFFDQFLSDNPEAENPLKDKVIEGSSKQRKDN